jgi:hypothetical protein
MESLVVKGISWVARWSGGGARGAAVRAQAVVDDLGLVDGEAVCVGCVQARGVTHRAVHVDDHPAPAAYEVVVVVADARLVTRH